MKHSADYYIEHLQMESHVEGGYFKECLPEKEERNLWSSIYFMLAKGEVSHFHRLKSDEVWYYHDGNALTIYMIDEAGKLTAAKLGLNLEQGEASVEGKINSLCYVSKSSTDRNDTLLKRLLR